MKGPYFYMAFGKRFSTSYRFSRWVNQLSILNLKCCFYYFCVAAKFVLMLGSDFCIALYAPCLGPLVVGLGRSETQVPLVLKDTYTRSLGGGG